MKAKPLPPPNKKESSAAFFGGGVDAFATLIAHIAEKPTLMTLWGSDIPLKDTDGWEVVKNHTLKTAENFGLQAIFVKTNFRELLNYIELNRLVKMSGDNYWHGFQHGIGIIGHAAPLAAKNGFSTIYIASSYTVNDNKTCASHPDIDGNVRFAGCNIIHDQYEYDRQAKVDHICSFQKSWMKSRIYEYVGSPLAGTIVAAVRNVSAQCVRFSQPDKILINTVLIIPRKIYATRK